METRTVDTCQFRTAIESGTGHCGLLEELSGLANHQLTIVERDACEACCETFPATAADPNLVVASLAAGLAETIIATNGVAGCSVEQAVQLQTFAEERIPILNADELDLVPNHRSDIPDIPVETLRRLLPVAAQKSKSNVFDWAIAVTTSPRRQPTLNACLERLDSCGWQQPLLSIDGDVDVPVNFQELPVTQRTNPIGAWPNYYLTLSELVMQSPHADAYMVVQDDSIFANCGQLKSYLEELLWPVADNGSNDDSANIDNSTLDPSSEKCLVSLYCCADDTRETDGWFLYDGQWKFGALAMVFSPAAAQQFLRDERVTGHRLLGGKHSMAGIDAVIGDWAFRNQVPVWHSSPSLVQHIGNVSTIWETSGAHGLRRASRFIDDEA